MDVLPGAITDDFFILATDDCLTRMAPLISRGTSILITKFLNDPAANKEAQTRCRQFLGQAVRQVTFAQELRDKGYYQILFNLNGYLVGSMTDITKLQEAKAAVQFLLTNSDLLTAAVPHCTLDMFESFAASAPKTFTRGILRNRQYFYQPHAKDAPTGLGGFVQRLEDLRIIDKGLDFRILAAKSGSFKEVARV